MNAVLIGVLLYVLAQLVVGMLVSRRIATEDDYLLAGRSFGCGMATFSFFATWFGAESCIGASGKIYREGLAGASADPFGYGACLLLMGLVFAVPLWRRRLTTLADLFRQRYSPGVERLATLMMVPTSVLWAAAQIRGFGQVLGASSGMNTTAAITLAAATAILYTAFGGMRADVVTDFIQGIMIIVGLAVLWVVLFPGVAEVQTAWRNIEPARLSFFSGGKSVLATLESWAVPVFGSIAAQELVSRALATKSPEIARRSALLGGGLYVLVGLIPAFLGLVGIGLLPKLDDPEQFLPALARQCLPPFLFVLFAGALVSAILSTVDSTLLAAASLTTHNLVLPLRRGVNEAGKVRLARSGVVLFGVVAWGLALSADTMFELVEGSSAFGSAGVFAILVFGLFTKMGGARSAYAALLAGLLVWVAGTYVWEVEFVYLLSLAGAFAAYGAVGLVERAIGNKHSQSSPPR